MDLVHVEVARKANLSQQFTKCENGLESKNVRLRQFIKIVCFTSFHLKKLRLRDEKEFAQSQEMFGKGKGSWASAVHVQATVHAS